MSQLVEVIEDVTTLLDEGHSVEIIYFDFIGAYDTTHTYVYNTRYEHTE